MQMCKDLSSVYLPHLVPNTGCSQVVIVSSYLFYTQKASTSNILLTKPLTCQTSHRDCAAGGWGGGHVLPPIFLKF